MYSTHFVVLHFILQTSLLLLTINVWRFLILSMVFGLIGSFWSYRQVLVISVVSGLISGKKMDTCNKNKSSTSMHIALHDFAYFIANSTRVPKYLNFTLGFLKFKNVLQILWGFILGLILLIPLKVFNSLFSAHLFCWRIYIWFVVYPPQSTTW